ncbi:hypothetical protein [Prosthecobacter sp.]|uniref:hypothetical protein n=1 Tax=Prosthecobacter sp. TaxID=1965333 RepID=UPI002487FAEB|nr:hypothetical protein [Prosthecobacter sp.]MDI1314821.1 hypothetical protein [Prosthecobacter sp.]
MPAAPQDRPSIAPRRPGSIRHLGAVLKTTAARSGRKRISPKNTTATEHSKDKLDNSGWKNDHAEWTTDHEEAAAILKRVQEELALPKQRIRAHEAEIATHEHEKTGSTPTSTHVHAEACHEKQKQKHEATIAHHDRIMEALHLLNEALK